MIKKLIISIAALGTLLGWRGPETQYMYPVSINEILTNSMSDTPQLKRMDQAVDSFMTYWDLKPMPTTSYLTA